MAHESLMKIKRHSQKKPRAIPDRLLGAGLAVMLPVVFLSFLLSGCQADSHSLSVADARQIGATDTAVLLSWQGSDRAERYRISYPDGANGFIVTESDIPYAVLRGLSPDNAFTAKIRAVSGRQESAPVSVACRTENRCDVTAIHVTDHRDGTAAVAWEFSGQNEGFTAIAYVLDGQGRRHLTTEAVTVRANEPPECVISGLYPGLSYTVAVMPLTKYHRTGKSTFRAQFYSDQYHNLNFLRFVICPADAKNTPTVRSLQTVQPSSPYKVSLTFNGKTDRFHTVPVSLLILGSDGQLCGEYRFSDVPTNPENKIWYVQRFVLLDFRSPPEEGNYQMVLLADGHRITELAFQVKRELS